MAFAFPAQLLGRAPGLPCPASKVDEEGIGSLLSVFPDLRKAQTKYETVKRSRWPLPWVTTPLAPCPPLEPLADFLLCLPGTESPPSSQPAGLVCLAGLVCACDLPVPLLFGDCLIQGPGS